MRLGDFLHQWCEFFILPVKFKESLHPPEIGGRKSPYRCSAATNSSSLSPSVVANALRFSGFASHGVKSFASCRHASRSGTLVSLLRVIGRFIGLLLPTHGGLPPPHPADYLLSLQQVFALAHDGQVVCLGDYSNQWLEFFMLVVLHEKIKSVQLPTCTPAVWQYL